MPDRRTFVLDEQVAIWAWTLCHVQQRGGRYVVPHPQVDEVRAASLLFEIHKRRLNYGISSELEGQYGAHYEVLRRTNVPLLGFNLLTHLNVARISGRLRVVRNPHRRAVPSNFPNKDRHLVDLCAGLGCNLVTEDNRLRNALAKGNLAGKLGFAVMGLDEALKVISRMPMPPP